MGWFWAEQPRDSKTAIAIAPRPISSANPTPPPACPMHTSSSPPPTFPSARDSTSTPLSPSSCPVKSPNHPLPSSLNNDIPSSSPQSTLSKLNPLNYMPSNLSNTRDHTSQTIPLPLSRDTSSIPRGDGSNTKWEYPSPQQMYNAMLRKGYTDTPTDAVESMVAVHNFLNEGAWEEIVTWEDIFRRGLREGWRKCSMGEEGLRMEQLREEVQRIRREELGLQKDVTVGNEDHPYQPQLVRFQGRPKDMTPKAGILQALGWVWPTKFGSEPPFDRHDWYITRRTPTGETKEIRYVIDYYSGDPEPTGEPVFYLDIRPAIDTPTAAVERMIRWGGDVWHRASGAAVREQNALQQKSREASG